VHESDASSGIDTISNFTERLLRLCQLSVRPDQRESRHCAKLAFGFKLTLPRRMPLSKQTIQGQCETQASSCKSSISWSKRSVAARWAKRGASIY
jgi:hypothetical protein